MAFTRICLTIVHYILAFRTLLFSLAFKWTKPLSDSYYRKQTLARIRSDAKCLKKLPLHVGFAVVEDEVSFCDIASVIVWSMAMGITYISLYDRIGNIKRNEVTLQNQIDTQKKKVLASDHKKFQVHLHSRPRGKTKPHSEVIGSIIPVEVQLLSIEDGRHSLVSSCRQLARNVKEKQCCMDDLTPALVESYLQDSSGFPDPDLVIRFGITPSMMGFLPWQIRLAEILSIPSHHSLDYKTFHQTLLAYGDTTQRFGK